MKPPRREASALPALLAVHLLLVLGAAGCAGAELDGGNLYRAHCARCHGAGGKGDRRSLGLYPNLDLTASPLVRAGPRGRGLIYQRISEGYGAMPGFAAHLGTADIEKLIDYILRLGQEKAGR